MAHPVHEAKRVSFISVMKAALKIKHKKLISSEVSYNESDLNKKSLKSFLLVRQIQLFSLDRIRLWKARFICYQLGRRHLFSSAPLQSKNGHYREEPHQLKSNYGAELENNNMMAVKKLRWIFTSFENWSIGLFESW